eukprot:9437538-Ditylum_brightwellii.AAC.1
MHRSDSTDDLEGADIWGDTPKGAPDPHEKKNADSISSSGITRKKRSVDEIVQDAEDMLLDNEVRGMTITEIRQLNNMLDNDIRVMKSDMSRITYESQTQLGKIRENKKKLVVNTQPPLLVSSIVEILDPDAED